MNTQQEKKRERLEPFSMGLDQEFKNDTFESMMVFLCFGIMIALLIAVVSHFNPGPNKAFVHNTSVYPIGAPLLLDKPVAPTAKTIDTTNPPDLYPRRSTDSNQTINPGELPNNGR